MELLNLAKELERQNEDSHIILGEMNYGKINRNFIYG